MYIDPRLVIRFYAEGLSDGKGRRVGFGGKCRELNAIWQRAWLRFCYLCSIVQDFVLTLNLGFNLINQLLMLISEFQVKSLQ